MFIGVYDYTVILTYMSLCSSLYGISCAIKSDFKAAVICLMISGLCDMFDGKVARTKKNRSEEGKAFGIQIDSLCDLVSFCVFPAVLVNCIVSGPGWAGARNWLVKIGGALLVLAGVIRLAYFNVTEEERQKETTEGRKYYLGLPVTSTALIFPLVCAISLIMGKGLTGGMIAHTTLLYAEALFFVWDIKVKKPGKLDIIFLSIIGLVIAGVIMFVK